MRGALASVFMKVSPPSYFFAASSGVFVIVPFLGFGIKPLGPRVLATFASLGIIAGVAKRISKFTFPVSTSEISSSVAIATLKALPVPWGRVVLAEIFGSEAFI